MPLEGILQWASADKGNKINPKLKSAEISALVLQRDQTRATHGTGEGRKAAPRAARLVELCICITCGRVMASSSGWASECCCKRKPPIICDHSWGSIPSCCRRWWEQLRLCSLGHHGHSCTGRRPTKGFLVPGPERPFHSSTAAGWVTAQVMGCRAPMNGYEHSVGTSCNVLLANRAPWLLPVRSSQHYAAPGPT